MFPCGYRLLSSIVRAEDVEVSMFSVDAAPSNVIRSKQAIVGKKARSRLLEGRMATDPMLYDAAVVTSGQRVRVVLESDAIQIATRGTLRHDARIGERVGVELENGTTVEAEVRDDQTVIIRN
jgi:flagella basal body P-ring formation protein FlgA